jgi:hypothetical protein
MTNEGNEKGPSHPQQCNADMERPGPQFGLWSEVAELSIIAVLIILSVGLGT